MQHCDPTTLALYALGEDIEPDERAHLESCEACLTDAAELAAVVSIGREAPERLEDPPEHVWSAVRAELGLINAPDGSDAGPARVLAPVPVELAGEAAGVGNVIPLAPRRRGLFTVAAVAAVAGAVVGGAVVWSALESGSGPGGQTTSEVLVARAVLDPLQDSVTAPGEATVVDSADGQVIRVDATALPKREGFYEVWLLDADATKLVALGALPSGSVGTFTVPPGVSIEDYPVVDISLEADDGDPGHSHNSLMRGTIEA